jgi:hypothetical protein
MKKLDKETLAVYSVIGLIVFALVSYGVYSMSNKKTSPDGDQPTAEQKTMFTAPVDGTQKDKEEYKSTLDQYEELQAKQEAEQKPISEPIGFDKTLKTDQTETTAKEIPRETTTTAQVKQTSNTAIPKKVVKEQSNDVTETPAQETGGRRKLVSSSQRLEEAKTVVTEKENTNTETDPGKPAEIPVVVHGDQKVLNNQRIRLRVIKEMRVKNYTIDAEQILVGTCVFINDRVRITVYTFRSKGETVKMKLFAYDKGELGIYAPTTTDQEIASQTGQTVTQRVRFTIPTPIGGIPIGGGAGGKKIAEQEKRFEITSQYSLTLSDTEQ